jgi:hypothetical protein
MEEFKPFKYNIGDAVYMLDVYAGVLVGTKSIVIRRFRTKAGNVYTTMADSNVPEAFLVGREEYIMCRLAGKILEI